MIYNLLKMTQLILSSMDGDEVNDIDDTVESRQVVDIIEVTYNDLISTLELPEQWVLFELEASGDTSRPTLMTIPDNIVQVDWLQYDNSDDGATERDWQYVFPMNRETFLNRMNTLDTTDETVYQYDFLVGAETFDIRGYNNRNPSYYTSFDTRTLVFNDFDSNVGQTLIGNRTMGYGKKEPVFVRSNTFEPPMDSRQFTLFFNEAKAQCFIDLKQVENTKAERRARRGWNLSGKKKATTDASPRMYSYTPDYGRISRK